MDNSCLRFVKDTFLCNKTKLKKSVTGRSYHCVDITFIEKQLASTELNTQINWALKII